MTDLATRPALKYVGFALLLAWHYALWFVPHMFTQTELLDERVTISWLVNLGATVVSLLLIAFMLGRKRHLSAYRWLYVAAPALTCLATLAICLIPRVFTVPGLAYALSFFLGITESVMWILWGERYACVKANFTLRHIGTTFGLTLLGTIILAWVLPSYVTTAFVSLLPIASGMLLVAARRDGSRAFPVLLPKSAAQGGLKNMVAVSIITFLASVACYFLVAIIPWEVLPTGDVSFTLGILGGAAIMLGIAGISIASKDKASIFKMFPLAAGAADRGVRAVPGRRGGVLPRLHHGDRHLVAAGNPAHHVLRHPHLERLRDAGRSVRLLRRVRARGHRRRQYVGRRLRARPPSWPSPSRPRRAWGSCACWPCCWCRWCARSSTSWH
ncbi:MAG: hypothetical protein ACLR9M_01495 [Eggerthella lenta]